MEQKIIVITLEGDIKYQIGIDKTVEEVLSEIAESTTEFYNVVPECSIKKEKIMSVEQVIYVQQHKKKGRGKRKWCYKSQLTVD